MSNIQKLKPDNLTEIPKMGKPLKILIKAGVPLLKPFIAWLFENASSLTKTIDEVTPGCIRAIQIFQPDKNKPSLFMLVISDNDIETNAIVKVHEKLMQELSQESIDELIQKFVKDL